MEPDDGSLGQSLHTHIHTHIHVDATLAACARRFLPLTGPAMPRAPTFKYTSIWGSGDVTSHTSTTSGRSASCFSSAIFSWLSIFLCRLDSFFLPSSAASVRTCVPEQAPTKSCNCVTMQIFHVQLPNVVGL